MFQLLDSPVESPKCQGRFCDKGQKFKISPNLPLGSLEMFICGESSPKFQMYNEQKTNGALTREKSKCHNWNTRKCRKSIQKHNMSKTSTHNQREKKIERGCEEEREGSPIPIFPPLPTRIVWMLAGRMSFCSKISILRVERGGLVFELKREFYIEFGVLLMTGFWLIEKA